MFARPAVRTLAFASLRPAWRMYTTEATSPLLLKLKADVKDAMRSKDKERLTVVKSVLSDLVYLEKSPQAPEKVTDSVIQVLIQKSIKRREESIHDFEKAGRSELAAQEQKGIDMLKVYLPQEMTEQEIEAEVRKAIEATGASSAKDVGKVMKELSGMDPARAPKKTVSEVAKRILSSQ
ncbi:hypothetical protein DFQ27_002136 [Actinomortierella ambigua]|uniref:Altered inheritance of mitochondria protein 41 n=1 Tax=Actinomortierella ambigua TaxID=1343610 RepID=A0A9P6U7F9_9FUNG|nr:hypothetical protein DFQ26_003608 [Actinomortierella ambigua]KAG0262770.1 hypothetical protein DFQ27_002136 [Actinomortierella ambigua]